eukprot:CAMPEP_0173392748 /NCGR_PEP_ID=MMETSP1356-20130122/21000_1 /TAXON_ID=77927 ORGANISM="Hemiselmis virescens, Strain PCC157" /NCGR_SAMPLE_ID=MMETSP1356 /ASSEMBLY_ACC=CAM_ASM_000847 /LENGTH=151 /DNA_ID=CAMNT_0014350637 /DNA_START=246 /DNA_END=698 /DNA_ORIENTATION=+
MSKRRLEITKDYIRPSPVKPCDDFHKTKLQKVHAYSEGLRRLPQRRSIQLQPPPERYGEASNHELGVEEEREAITPPLLGGVQERAKEKLKIDQVHDRRADDKEDEEDEDEVEKRGWDDAKDRTVPEEPREGTCWAPLQHPLDVLQQPLRK